MAKRIYAIVKSELLKWGRTSAGFKIEVVAKKMRVHSQKIIDWENGNKHPTVNQLRNLARIYKRPLAAFYLPKVPKDFQVLHDYRKLPDTPDISESPELMFAIRNAQLKRDQAIDIANEISYSIREFSISTNINVDVDNLADRIRNLLGVSIERQITWKHNWKALNNWKRALEALDVLVFQASGVSEELMSGFSIYNKKFPVIVINSKSTYTKRIFTVFHELAHLLLKGQGVCDLFEKQNDISENARTEAFCNRFAASFLVPKSHFLNQDILWEIDFKEDWEISEVAALSKIYNVSREVIARRLVTLEKAPRGFYTQLRERLSEEWKSVKKKRKGFIEQYKKPIVGYGHLFIRLVLDAYYQNLITTSNINDYLGVKTKYLPTIEKEVW